MTNFEKPYEYRRRWNPPGSIWIARGEVALELILGAWVGYGFRSHDSKLVKLAVVLIIALNRSLAKIYNSTTLSVRNGAFVRKTGPFFFWRGRRMKIRQSDIVGVEIVGNGEDDLTVEVLSNGKRIEIDWNITREQASEMKKWLSEILGLPVLPD